MSTAPKLNKWKVANPRAQVWLQLKKAEFGLTHQQLAQALPQFNGQQISNALFQMATAHVVLKDGAANSKLSRFMLNPVGPVPTFDATEEDAEPTGESTSTSDGSALQAWLTPGVDLGPKRPLRDAAAPEPAPVAAPAPAAETVQESAPAPAAAPASPRAPMLSPVQRQAAAAYGEQFDRARDAASSSSLGLRTRRTGPAAATSPVTLGNVQIGVAPLPLAGETSEEPADSGFVCALFSNGKLQLQVHGQVITLSLEHTRQLMHYLDHMDGGAVVSDAASQTVSQAA